MSLYLLNPLFPYLSLSQNYGCWLKMVIMVILTLAAYDMQTFSEHYVCKSMGHLLTQLELGKAK